VHLIKQRSTSNKNVRVVVNPPIPQATGNPNMPNDFGTPGPAATEAPPASTPTPKPACSAPDVPAKAIDAITPQAPLDAPDAQATAKIKVDLDASGNVAGVSVYATTGSPQLDRAALEAARESRYEPEERNCKKVSGSYLFTVDFEE
jgi:protein TonB